MPRRGSSQDSPPCSSGNAGFSFPIPDPGVEAAAPSPPPVAFPLAAENKKTILERVNSGESGTSTSTSDGAATRDAYLKLAQSRIRRHGPNPLLLPSRSLPADAAVAAAASNRLQAAQGRSLDSVQLQQQQASSASNSAQKKARRPIAGPRAKSLSNYKGVRNFVSVDSSASEREQQPTVLGGSRQSLNNSRSPTSLNDSEGGNVEANGENNARRNVLAGFKVSPASTLLIQGVSAYMSDGNGVHIFLI